MSSARATIFSYLGQHKFRLLSGVLLVGLSSFIAVLPPLLIGRIVDSLTAGSGLDVIERLALLMVGLALIENVLRDAPRVLPAPTHR